MFRCLATIQSNVSQTNVIESNHRYNILRLRVKQMHYIGKYKCTIDRLFEDINQYKHFLELRRMEVEHH